MTIKEEFEKSFCLWDVNKDVNEYEAFKAGAKWVLEQMAKDFPAYYHGQDDTVGPNDVSYWMRKLAKELDEVNENGR